MCVYPSNTKLVTKIVNFNLPFFSLTTNVYNSEVTNLLSQVEITILPDENRAPEFRPIAPVTLSIPVLADFIVLNLGEFAVDPDSPLVDAGDLVFAEVSEVTDGEEGRTFGKQTNKQTVSRAY